MQVFDSITVRSQCFRNRAWVPPMSQYSAPDGLPTRWHQRHYGTLALTAGCVIVEATAVSPVARVTPEDLGLYNELQSSAFAEVARCIAEHGAAPAIQLSHAGRKASRTSPWMGDRALEPAEGGWERLAPSTLQFSTNVPPPMEMSIEDIDDVIRDFARSARIAVQAGFRLIEVHAGHGRLLHSFMSAISNVRTDKYSIANEGGSRLACNVASAIRNAIGEDVPLSFRLSCVDWLDGGVTIDDTVRLSCALKDVGVDLIDCSSGGIVAPLRKTTFAGYQVPFAAAIRKRSGILTAAVGEITSVEHANQILSEESADVVLFGRRALIDPMYLGREAMRGQVETMVPLPYQRAMRSMNNRNGSLPPEL